MTVHHLVPNASPSANRFAKTRRPFLEPISDPKNNPHFEKPPITNNVNLLLPLRVIVPEAAALAQDKQKLVFHVIGDSGGIHGDDVQGAVAEAMESQIKSAQGADKPSFPCRGCGLLQRAERTLWGTVLRTLPVLPCADIRHSGQP